MRSLNQGTFRSLLLFEGEYMKIQTAAVGIPFLLLFLTAPAAAQDASIAPACAVPLRYEDGSEIDPQNLRAWSTVTYDTISVPVYPDMTPNGICSFLEPIRLQLVAEREARAVAIGEREKAVSQGAEDAKFRERMEESLFHSYPNESAFLIVSATILLMLLLSRMLRAWRNSSLKAKAKKEHPGTLSRSYDPPRQSSFVVPER